MTTPVATPGAQLLDPAVLARISNLELRARAVVEGFIQGLHRAPHLGASTDFAEHRPYVPGDDTRRIDWKVYARSDRYYVKEFEADTNTNLVVFLDVSRSMLYGSKLRYATTLAACLAYFSSLQRDRVGLATFANGVVDFVPPSAKHLRLVLHSLDHAERLVPKQAASPTRLRTIFQRLSDVVRRRSMVAVISDFYEEPDDVVAAINMLRGRGNDIMALHVLEPSERTFPFTESSNFVDLESDEKMPVIPEYLREGYQKVIADHIATLSSRLVGQGVDYAHFDTSEPMDKALFAYLGARSRIERSQKGGLMGILAPAFLAGLLAIAIPVVIHMINRERRETIVFPSLMFLRKVPYKSVRRQKLRHILLLVLRCLAIAVIIAAFARPFFQRQIAPAAASSDGREVVVLLDRSYSMGLATRWTRATDAVKTIASEIRATDRVSVIAFDATAAQVVEPTASASRVNAVISTLKPGSAPTKFGPAFRMAAQILTASEQARREIVLISDFHRIGFTTNDEVALPLRTNVKTVDVSRGESGDAAVASVAIARTKDGNRARATVTARVTNLGAEVRNVDATLELAGRPSETRPLRVPPRSTAQVVFAPANVSAAATRAVVRITRDSQPANDAFYFTIAEDAGASTLIIEPVGARPNQSLFASRAWAVADDPVVRVDVRSSSVLTPADLRGRSLIVMNESELPAGTVGEQIRQQVRAGAILLVVPGERPNVGTTPEWRAELPASVGPVSDHVGRWANVDFSNALFEPFKTSRSDFSSVTLTKYRALSVTNGGAVIARLDDGSPLIVERAVGSGRILMWALSLDANWTDAPFHPLWVPLLHQLARRSIAGSEVRAYFTAPHVLDLSREGSVVVESPSGIRTRISPDSQPRSVELKERGFYEVRSGSVALGAGRPVAVNVDLSESDQSHFDPAELVAAVTARGERSAARGNDAVFEGTAQELERRQAVWWYLLFGAVLLLAGETMFSNRLSRRVKPPAIGTSEGTQNA